MRVKKFLANNEKWVTKKLNLDPDYFKKLGQGQNPKLLYIGCSDSRVTAEEMMGAEPGEVFVHRNIANLVVNIDLNSMSVINYAIEHLNVEHAVVCGHYGCGGIQAALETRDLGVINPWLRNIRDVFRLYKHELLEIKDEQQRRNRLVELNVQEQCVNLVKNAVVQKAMREKGLKLHGWVFDTYTGRLKDFKINFPKILKEIEAIYQID